MAAKQPTSIAERVALVINRYWRGNVNAAAKALGVAQPTLFRIVTGATPQPRASVLEAIVSGCPAGTTIDWLVSGRGPEPPSVDEAGRPIRGSVLRFWAVLDQLPLDAQPRGPIANAFATLAFAPMMFAVRVSDSQIERVEDLPPFIEDAIDQQADMWADLVQSSVDEYGADNVVRAIRTNLTALLGGFTMSAVGLAASNGQDNDLTRAWERLSGGFPEASHLTSSKTPPAAKPRANRRRAK